MIVVKPKISTLFSLGIFILISLGVSIYMLSYMLRSNGTAWYQYLIVLILAPLALGLLARLIWGYKRVEVGQERISIAYPVRLSKKSYPLKEVNQWTEHQVKTGGSTFKELNVRFTDGKKLELSMQEHSRYSDVIKYLRKKCPKKFIQGK